MKSDFIKTRLGKDLQELLKEGLVAKGLNVTCKEGFLYIAFPKTTMTTGIDVPKDATIRQVYRMYNYCYNEATKKHSPSDIPEQLMANSQKVYKEVCEVLSDIMKKLDN